MNRESLVSTERRLLYNCRNLLDFRDGGPAVPMTFFVSPTNRCQLRCPSCLYGGKDGGLELDGAALARFAEITATMGIKAWELTGGGEPLVHPGVNGLVRRLHELRISVGLMTNGLALNRLEHPEFLRWVRVSLHGLDQHEDRLVRNIEAVRGKTKLTCCYLATMGNFDSADLERVRALAREHDWTVKIEIDWFAGNTAIGLWHLLDERLEGDGHAFLDPALPTRHREPGPCYMHLIKPFLYADGWVYACPCAVGQGRDVSPEFRVCRMEDVTEYYVNPPKSYARACPVCKYDAMNRVAEGILEPLEDPEFC